MSVKCADFDSLQKYTKSLSVALGYRDRATGLHSERVNVICLEMGVFCGLSREELATLNIAAAFHDLGKIGIPDAVLLKQARFDDEEWEVMKTHSVIGENIMRSMNLEGSDLAAKWIRHHHEHYDGSGYPDGLQGDNIPLGSRIISIVDSYDAMAVTRSYHCARDHKHIMAILDAESGIKHDPKLLRVFTKFMQADIKSH